MAAPFLRDNQYPYENLLKIQYRELYEMGNSTYVALEKLMKFTGLSFNESLIANWEKYVQGRNRLLKQYQEQSFKDKYK